VARERERERESKAVTQTQKLSRNYFSTTGNKINLTTFDPHERYLDFWEQNSSLSSCNPRIYYHSTFFCDYAAVREFHDSGIIRIIPVSSSCPEAVAGNDV
jgi:hypothetical protein